MTVSLLLSSLLGDSLLELRQLALVLSEGTIYSFDGGASSGDLSLVLGDLLHKRFSLSREISLRKADVGDGGLEVDKLLGLSLSGLQSGLQTLLHLLGINGGLRSSNNGLYID